MKKIFFYSFPGYGHVLPTLNVARELHHRGHKVTYYATEQFREIVTASGVTFKPYVLERELDNLASRNVATIAHEILELTRQTVPALEHDIAKEKPDCIVHDGVSLSGKVLSKKYDIPAVTLIATLAFTKKAILQYPGVYFTFLAKGISSGKMYVSVRRRYFQLMKSYGLSVPSFEDIVMNKEKLNLVFTSSFFHPCSKYFDASYKFVGPSLYPRKEKSDFLKKLTKSKKTIFISLGTVVNDDKTFYEMCMNALKDTKYQVIMTLGKGFHVASFVNIPKNFILKEYVNQLEVLQHTDLFITHAGMNGVNESLFYGVPMLLVPDTDEQTVIAMRTKELGAGIWLKKRQLNKELLIKTIDKIFANPVYKIHAKEIQKSLQINGYKKGAEEIINYLGQK